MGRKPILKIIHTNIRKIIRTKTAGSVLNNLSSNDLSLISMKLIFERKINLIPNTSKNTTVNAQKS